MRTSINLLVAITLLAAPAALAETRVLLCFPGGPGTTEQAQPVVDQFLSKLAAQAGWDKASGAYYNDMARCAAEIKAGKADVAMIPLDVYLAQRGAWKLAPVAKLANKETAGQYHIVAKKGATLDSIKGQQLSTGLKASDSFLTRVALESRVDVSKDFKVKRRRSALKSVKDVAKGKAAAALLDDVAQKALDGLPMAKDLVTVLSGPELPGAIVAGVGSTPSKLGEALLSLCTAHRSTCDEMRVKSFKKVDVTRLTELEKKLTQ